MKGAAMAEDKEVALLAGGFPRRLAWVDEVLTTDVPGLLDWMDDEIVCRWRKVGRVEG